MSFDRRELLKRSGAVTAGLALGSSAASHTVSAQDDAGLVFWDSLNAPPRSDIMDEVASRFSEANDGVPVEHRGWTTDELVATLPRSVEGNQGPDVSQVNNGEALMGPMIRGNFLVPINDYATEYGWDTLMPEGLLARNRYSSDGTQFGEGELWGVSAETEIVGFFYNRSIFEEHGLAIPKTVAEFETLLGTLRDNGVEPILFGLLDGWQGIHMFGEIHGAYTTREYLDNIIYRRNNASFEDQSIVDAATKLVEWKEKGFFLEGLEGVNADDAIPVFTSGAGAMLLQGSWDAGRVAEGLGDEAGFFLMPPIEEGGSVLHVGGVGLPYAITTNAEDPDIAAALINEIVSEETRNAILDAGILPAGEIPADRIVEGTLSGELYAAWNAALEADAIGHYLDWATPDFSDIIVGEIQKLMAGETDPDTFATTLQDAYARSFES